MTFRIQNLSSFSEEELAALSPDVTAVLGTLPADRFVPVATIQRPDYSHLIVEGYRSESGALQYFLRDTGSDEGRDAPTEAATPFEASGRVYLNLEGLSIVQIYYGDYDGDLSNDMILRLSDGTLRALGTGEESLPEPIVPEAEGSGSPYDPEPTPAPHNRQNQRTDGEPTGPPSASSGAGSGTSTPAQQINTTARMGI